jgi:hypothetical protein
VTTPGQRRAAARIAASIRWSRVTDRPRENRHVLDRFERQADPDGTLDPQVRAAVAKNLRDAYFTRLSRQGVAARQRQS